MIKPSVNKTVALLILALLLTSPLLSSVNVSGAPATTLYVDPPSLEVVVGSPFRVDVDIDSFFDVYYFGIILTYDQAIVAGVDVEVYSPFLVTGKDVGPGYMIVEGMGGPVTGNAKLAYFSFQCMGIGGSPLEIAEYYLEDPTGTPIFADEISNGYVTQTPLYWKASYADYTPSGVPDFDQKQWGVQNWTNPFPPVGTWSYCGPVAVANSLWWLDSEYEPNPIPPPVINDGFPLVQSYAHGIWDDHDPQNVPPLVEDLAFLMDTNGQRTGLPHCGTEVHDMAMALNEYIDRQGLDWKFYVHLQKAPDFLWIEQEIKKCQDVVLLLGFWQFDPYTQQWVRVGGHYVTCAGVDSTNWMLAISDPYVDAAEIGLAPGQVLPPPPHPHTGPPERLHNDAAFVSHDFYSIGPSPSPGGPFGFNEYPAEYVIDNFGSCQNTPQEFIPLDGEYLPGQPIYTEIEYAVVTSCKTGVVAAGSEDGNVYVYDFYGNLQWTWSEEAYCVSVAMDNEAKYLAGGWRYSDYGILDFFDVNAVTGGGLNAPLWSKSLPISESYDGGWGGKESKSVDVKYNYYNQCYVVAAAHDNGLDLYDQWGNLIWQYFDQEGPETIVRISQDGNYIVCADYNSMILHYFSHLRDGVPGWGPGDGIPVWSFGGYMSEFAVYWTAISGLGDYVAVSGWFEPYPPSMPSNSAGVILLNRTGGMVWAYGLLKGGYVRVDMPCDGKSVVSVNDDPSDSLGCDLNYFSDGGDGWDSGDGMPLWNFWPGKEVGAGQTPTNDFYTVSISENGDYIATGGGPTNTYLFQNDGTLTPGGVQSVDLTFSGKYGASVDNSGSIWFFNKDTGFMWSWANPYQAPFRCVAVSKIYPCMFPYPNHDVDVHALGSLKTVINIGFRARFNVTLSNEGDFTETAYVAIWAQNATATLLVNSTTVVLAPGAAPSITLTWTPIDKGNYTMFATINIVHDETDVYDNTFINGKITVSIQGDVDGDGDVDIYDVVKITAIYGFKLGDLGFNPNSDLDDDNVITIYDVVRCTAHYGDKDP
jgi:hypothetical protein